MTNEPKIALALIVAPTDREAELLDRLLSGKIKDYVVPAQREIDLRKVGCLADAVDGIFITITGENAKCTEVAQKYGAHISHFTWVNDFSKARNFNFSQVPEEYQYICWFDADDMIENPQLLRGLAQKCADEALDAIVLRYLYEFDNDGNCSVEHMKTRIVKNDGCMTWASEIHEDFKQNRQISASLNEEIRVLHLTDPKRIEDSALRNRVIAESAVQNNPSDPHSYWNLANTYCMTGNFEEASKIYLQFLEISNSDEERFLSWFRLASVYAQLGHVERAIEAALEALALRPWYPDAYHLLGELNFSLGKFRAAKEFIETGLTKNVPEMESIVWNPLDYSYRPHDMLWQIYFQMNMPRDAIKHLKECLKIKPRSKYLQDAVVEVEKGITKFDIAEDIYKRAVEAKNVDEVKKILEETPEDMKYYPTLVNLRNQYFIKDKSSGKDVVIFCAYTSHEWNPKVARETGVGGSEEAVIQLSKRFAKKGYNVTVYASTPQSQEYIEDGVIWKPFTAWNFRDKQDIVILWRHPKMIDFDINADKIYMDVHDVVPASEFIASRLKKITKVMFKSEVQRKNYPNIPDEKCLVVPHGLDIDEFESQRDSITRNPYMVLNTSSPDRGLKTFMEIIKRTYNKLPDNLKPLLKAEQYYGFDIWDVEFSDDMEMMKWKKDAQDKIKELVDLGIMTSESGKRLSQKEITKKYLEAGVLLYPSEFFEIGYIGGIKGMLGGAIPFTTSAFAQGEFVREGVVVSSNANYDNWNRDLRDGSDYGVKEEGQINQFVDALVEYIKNPNKYNDMRQRLIKYAKETFNWDTTADAWIADFNGRPQ